MKTDKNITLVIVDTASHILAKFAIEQTLKTIDCNQVLVFSDKHVINGAKHVPIKKDISLHDYSEIMLNHLWLHVETEYALVIQWDGMAVNRDLWTDEFLNYDYIGAVWPWNTTSFRVGNGGFSLRSRKLIEALRDPKIYLGELSGKNEDVAICVEHRKLLQEKYNIQYAPIDIARQFATEHEWLGPTFGFHGLWNAPKFLQESDIRYIIENIPMYFWKDRGKVNDLSQSLAQHGFDKLLGICVEKSNSIK